MQITSTEASITRSPMLSCLPTWNCVRKCTASLEDNQLSTASTTTSLMDRMFKEQSALLNKQSIAILGYLSQTPFFFCKSSA